MPAHRLSATMSPDEIAAYQRERNRKKQKAYKDRQRAARMAELASTSVDRGDAASSQASIAPSTSPAVVPSFPYSHSTLAKSSNADQDPSRSCEPKMARRSADDRDPAAGEPEVAARREVGGTGNGSLERQRSTAPVALATRRTSPLDLFAAMMNDTSPSRLVPDPRATSFLPGQLNVNILRQSLGLPHHASPAGVLPVFTYNSPVDHSRPPAPTDSSWKVALFQLHTAMIANRANPIDGFLHNQDSRRTLAEAQLLITQLLYASSDKREVFARPRQLSQEDADFLANTRLDARIAIYSDPVALVQLARASLTIDITEMGGLAIEQSRIYGDVWDAGSSSLPDDFYVNVVPERLGQNGHRTEAGRHLRGASIREIVLGLDEPGWRNTEPVFPLFEKGHWDYMEEMFEYKTLGPRRKEETWASLTEMP